MRLKIRATRHGLPPGPHVYATFWMGEGPTLGNSGELVFRLEEWEAFRRLLKFGETGATEVEIDEVHER